VLDIVSVHVCLVLGVRTMIIGQIILLEYVPSEGGAVTIQKLPVSVC
jgi:hypothetical protein